MSSDAEGRDPSIAGLDARQVGAFPEPASYADGMPSVPSHGPVNSVLWFTSLREGEQGVTRRILDDLLPYLTSIGIHHQVFEVVSAGQFLAILNALADRTGPGSIQPILHFDMHGSTENGFKIASSGETVPWDAVAARLSAVNATLGNNLFVVSCACHGQYLGPEASLTRPCPYYVLVAPKGQVSAGFLEDAIVPFYEAVFGAADFVSACGSYLTPGFTLFHSERLLMHSLVKYVRRHCVGRGAAERREDLLSQAVIEGAPVRPETRQALRAGIVPDQAMVDGFVATFLMGKHPGFDIGDVMMLVRRDIDRRGR